MEDTAPLKWVGTYRTRRRRALRIRGALPAAVATASMIEMAILGKPRTALGLLLVVARAVQIVLEEEIKRLHPLLAAIFPIFEFFVNSSQDRRMSLRSYYPTLVMHYVASLYKMWPAVFLHAWFNSLVALNHQGAIMNTTWALAQNDSVMDIPGICVQESGDVWPVLGRLSKVSKPKLQPPCERRTACFRMGPAIEDNFPIVFRTCIHNEYAAVCSRVCAGKAPWDRDPAANTQLWGVLEFQYAQGLGAALRKSIPYEPDIVFDTWVSRFSATLGARYRQMRDEGLPVLNTRALRVKAFIKVERLPSNLHLLGHLSKKPRLIQGRSDHVKVLQGPFFWLMGKRLASVWNVESDIYYPGGGSANELGQWAQECEAAGLVPLDFDVSAWDSCVSPAAHSFWQSVCEAAGCPADVLNFMQTRQYNQRGKTRKGVVYSRLGQVSSGDGDTTCGNTAIHGICWRHVFTQLNVRARVVVAGDDSVVAVAKSDRERLLAGYARIWRDLGFNINLVTAKPNWDTVSFCSGFFWRTELGRVFGPHPSRVLSKTFWTIYRLNPRKELRFLRGVVLGLIQSASHVPILGPLLNRLESLTRGHKAIMFAEKDRLKFKTDSVMGVHDEALAQLSLICDLGTDTLLSMTTECANLRDTRHVFRGSRWREFADSSI